MQKFQNFSKHLKPLIKHFFAYLSRLTHLMPFIFAFLLHCRSNVLSVLFNGVFFSHIVRFIQCFVLLNPSPYYSRGYQITKDLSNSNGSVAAESLTYIIVASNNLFQWTIRLYNKLHVCQELCDVFGRNFFNVIVMDIRHTMFSNSVSLEVFIHIYIQ